MGISKRTGEQILPFYFIKLTMGSFYGKVLIKCICWVAYIYDGVLSFFFILLREPFFDIHLVAPNSFLNEECLAYTYIPNE